MAGYTVNVDVEVAATVGPDDAIDVMTTWDEIHRGAGASASFNEHSIGLTVSVPLVLDEATNAALAGSLVEKDLYEMLTTFKLEPRRTLALEVLADDEMDRRLEQPQIPELVGAADAAELLHVSRQRIHQLATNRADFPEPVTRLRMGPIWLADSVRAFGRRWERKPGRPKLGSVVLVREVVQMAGNGDVHTIPHGDGWANKREGNQRVTKTYDTKAAAQADGRRMAKDNGVEHVIHNKDGQIGEKNTYPRSRDPRSSKG